MIRAIAAMAENRVIGNRGVMPWHVPEEMKWFRGVTMGHTLVMGSTTYRHMSKKLAGRKVIVVSHRDQLLFEGDQRCDNLQVLLDQYRTSKADLIICGGASIYAQAMPYMEELYLSIIPGDFQGDTIFPELDKALKLASITVKNGFQIMTYKR